MTGRPISPGIAFAMMLVRLLTGPICEFKQAVIRNDFGNLADLARGHLAQGGGDTDVPEVGCERVK